MTKFSSQKLDSLLEAANSKAGVDKVVKYLAPLIHDQLDLLIAYNELLRIRYFFYAQYAQDLLHYSLGIEQEKPIFIKTSEDFIGMNWSEIKYYLGDYWKEILTNSKLKHKAISDHEIYDSQLHSLIGEHLNNLIDKQKMILSDSDPEKAKENFLAKKYITNRERASKGLKGNYFKLIYNRPKS